MCKAITHYILRRQTFHSGISQSCSDLFTICALREPREIPDIQPRAVTVANKFEVGNFGIV